MTLQTIMKFWRRFKLMPESFFESFDSFCVYFCYFSPKFFILCQVFSALKFLHLMYVYDKAIPPLWEHKWISCWWILYTYKFVQHKHFLPDIFEKSPQLVIIRKYFHLLHTCIQILHGILINLVCRIRSLQTWKKYINKNIYYVF